MPLDVLLLAVNTAAFAAASDVDVDVYIQRLNFNTNSNHSHMLIPIQRSERRKVENKFE